MGCFYVYDNSLSSGKTGLSDNVIDGVKNGKLIGYSKDNNLEYFAAKSIYEIQSALAGEIDYSEDPDLIFYDASVSPQEEIKAKIKHAADLFKKAKDSGEDLGKEVTTLIKETFPRSISVSKDDFYGDNKTAEWIRNFQLDLGTKIHECIAAYGTKNWNKTLNQTVDFLFEKKSQIKDLNLETVYTKNRVKMLLELVDKEAVSSDLTSLVEKLHEEFEGKDVLFEVPLYYDSPTGERIQGRLDAIVIDSDGNITIYDFKTSATMKHNENSDRDHYAQLFLYKNLLASYGIPPKKIKIMNTHIRYAEGFSKILEIPNSEIYKIFSLNSASNPVRYQSDVNAAFRKYFPRTSNILTAEEERKLVEKISGLKSTIFSEKILNKESEDHFTEYIEKLPEDKPIYSYYHRSTFTIKRDGDRIKLIPVDRNITPDDIDELLADFIANELDARKTHKIETLELFKDALESGDPQQISNLMTSRYGGRNINILTSIGEYIHPDWEVVNSPIFDNLGIIVMYNSLSDTYDFINLIDDVNFDATYHLSLDEQVTMNALGNVLTEQELARYKDGNMPATVGNIASLRALIAISLASKTLKKEGNNLKIGQIKIVSKVTGNSHLVLNQDPYIKQLRIIKDAESKKGGASNLDLNSLDELLNNISTTQFGTMSDQVLNMLRGVMFMAYTSDDSRFTRHWIDEVDDSTKKGLSIAEKIQGLQDIQEEFRKEFLPYIQDKTSRQYNTDYEKIDQMLSVLITSYQGLLTDQVFATSGMSVDYNNSLRLSRQLLKHGNISNISSEGFLITGLLQGLSSATPYANPDDIVRQLSTLHNFATTKIQLEAEKYIENQNQATSKWIASKESLAKTLLNGNHRDLYALLFEKDENGNISKEFRFKNPFDEQSDLTLEDREFLKTSIWNLYRLRAVAQDSKIKSYTYDELVKDKTEHEKFKKACFDLNSGVLNIPLRTAKDGRLVANIAKSIAKGDFKKVSQFWKKKLEKSRHWWDPIGLTDKQLNEKEEKIKALQAYNMYAATSKTDRKTRLAETPLDGFEWNVNFLVNDFIYSYVSVEVNQEVLNTTDRLIAVLQWVHQLTGKDVSGQIEEIKKRTRISIYNMNTADRDYKDVVDLVSHLRTVYNLGVIGFRPILMAKELTLGRIKNIMHTAFGYFDNDEISMKNMLLAEKIVFSEGVVGEHWSKATGKMKPGDRLKVDALNWLYRIANMDANILTQKTLADRVGFLNMGGDIAYYTNVRPDWYNRLSIFVAKMLQDGTWDAHYLDENNHLVYDMKRDERYNVFCKYLNKPEPKKGNTDFEEYQKQKARYNYALDSFNKVGIKNRNGQALKYGDLLPIAYTVEETNSIKEITGMLYGYYNHEEKTSFQTGTYSQLFMAFKTYLAGELKYYFALPNGKTSVGKIAQITDGIPTEEHPEGSPLYIQHDDVTDLDIYTTEKYDKNGNANDPYYGWTSNQIEGLITSTIICLGDIFTERGREDLRTNKRRRKNAEMFLLRMLIALLLGSLGILIKAKNDSKEQKDAQKGLNLTLNVLNKVGNDLSFYHSVLEPVDDLGLVGVDYLEKLAKNTVTAMTNGDKKMQRLIYKNISAANDFKEFLEEQ